MPQSTGSLPSAICLRLSITRSTVGCTLKPSGTAVSLSANLCSSASGTCVSAASVHFELRNGAQSTANLLLKLESTGLTVCWPASSMARYCLISASGSSGAITPCASSLSA